MALKAANLNQDMSVSVDRVADVAELQSPLIECFWHYWEYKRQGRVMPTRRDIDPVEMAPSLLPYVILAQIERTPFRVLYRLVGTNAVDVGGCDFTGYYLDQLEFSAWDHDWASLYRIVVNTEAPYFAFVTLRPDDGISVRYPWALFPLSGPNGDVTHIMEIEDLPFSHDISALLSGRIKKGATGVLIKL